MHLELLLAVQQAVDVLSRHGSELAAVAGRLTERCHERGRRDNIAPLGDLAHAVVQVGRVIIADGPRELLDLAPFDRHHERRELPSDQPLVELDGHQAAPFFITRSRNLARSGTRARSWRPSATLSLSSHASTWNRNRLPSVSSRVARARTVIPTGVAARCRMSIMVPTLEAAAGRCGSITRPAASSSRLMRYGVANTFTPRWPMASAVTSAVTVRESSTTAPISGGIASRFTAGPATFASPCRPAAPPSWPGRRGRSCDRACGGRSKRRRTSWPPAP